MASLVRPDHVARRTTKAMNMYQLALLVVWMPVVLRHIYAELTQGSDGEQSVLYERDATFIGIRTAEGLLLPLQGKFDILLSICWHTHS